MKELPILFSAPMVRALLAGTKTQTRRAVKPQPDYPVTGCAQFGGPKLRSDGIVHCHEARRDGWQWVNGDDALRAFRCPYGQPGDRLWVREAWSTHAFLDNVKPSELTTRSLHYWADGDIKTGKRRPGMFMPRWASRLILEITDVRVERLQDISEDDAKAEGAWGPDESIVSKVAEHFGRDPLSVHPSLAYRMLWELINGPDSWEANPWVWVVEFRRAAA